MYGKLSTRRRAERCAPSVFVALTTAFAGISRSALAAIRSCSVTCAAVASVCSPEGQVAPERDRAERVVGRDGEHDRGSGERGGEVRPVSRYSRGAEHRCGHQHRDQPGRVVEADRRLRGRRREQVGGELRNGGDEHERREQREQAERNQKLQQVAQAAPGERGGDDLPRVGDRGAQDPAGRSADLVVAREEARAAGAVEVRDDDLDREGRDGDSAERDQCALDPSPAGERVPDPEPGDHEPDLLLGRHRGEREERERDQPVLVEVPEREQQERAGERDRVELVQRQPLRGRVEEVGEREPEPGALRVEVLAGEPEDRQGAERHRDRLGDEQRVRARPQEPQRRKGGERGVEVGRQARDLVSAKAGHLQRVAVRGRPDGLDHVSEVEPPGLERPVPKHRERREAGGVGGDRRPEQDRRSERAARGHRDDDRTAIARSSRASQRFPRTSSLACSA